MKLKKILNEIRLNELGDTNFYYKVDKTSDTDFNSYYIDDSNFPLDGLFEIEIKFSGIKLIDVKEFDGILKHSKYYKIDAESKEDIEFNRKYANRVYVSFGYDGVYETISNDPKLALNIMGTVTHCVMDSIKDFQKRYPDREIHFIKYDAVAQIKTDRKTGDDVSDGGAKRDRLYKMFIKQRVTGYKFDTKQTYTLIQFDKIK
jgi:hypothetical protein